MSTSSREGIEVGKTKIVVKKQRWYLGGTASAMAVFFTHPLDLLKVQLQTQQSVTHGLSGMAVHVVKEQGVFGLYKGLSASIMRQLTYSTTRYGLYEIWSGMLRKGNEPLPFYQKLILGAGAGFLGGIIGNPADMINVRMQNDIKLPLDKRRNYKNVFDGLYKCASQEGLPAWMRGVTMTSTRALLMTVSQGTIATTLTQPFDVMKTRMMEARPGQYKNALHCVVYTAKLGPKGFYKGFVPAWVRLAPHTIITWIFLEQLRIMFPYR